MAVTLWLVSIVVSTHAMFDMLEGGLGLTDILFARWNAQVSLNFLLNAVLVRVSISNGPLLLPRCGFDLAASGVGSEDKCAMLSPACEHTVLGLG